MVWMNDFTTNDWIPYVKLMVELNFDMHKTPCLTGSSYEALKPKEWCH